MARGVWGSMLRRNRVTSFMDHPIGRNLATSRSGIQEVLSSVWYTGNSNLYTAIDNRTLPSYFYNVQCSGHSSTVQGMPNYENRPIDSKTERFMKCLNIFPGVKAPLTDWGVSRLFCTGIGCEIDRLLAVKPAVEITA